MMGANASMFQNYLCFPVGMHFGGIWCPANSEPISRAKGEMVELMFKHCTFQVDLNLEVLKQLKVEIPTLQEPLAIAMLPPGVPPQSNPDGTIKFHYKMYVDDSQMAVMAGTDNIMYHMAASSLEAGYVFYGVPGPIEQPVITPTMAWDKLLELTISTILQALGLIVDTDKMEIRIPRK